MRQTQAGERTGRQERRHADAGYTQAWTTQTSETETATIGPAIRAVHAAPSDRRDGSAEPPRQGRRRTAGNATAAAAARLARSANPNVTASQSEARAGQRCIERGQRAEHERAETAPPPPTSASCDSSSLSLDPHSYSRNRQYHVHVEGQPGAWTTHRARP